MMACLWGIAGAAARRVPGEYPTGTEGNGAHLKPIRCEGWGWGGRDGGRKNHERGMKGDTGTDRDLDWNRGGIGR